MARKPMVTRAFKTTKVVALGLDTEKGEPSNKVVVVPRTFTDDNKLLKEVQKLTDTDTYKVVKVVNKEEVQTLRGMSEADFLKYSVELDANTRKVLEAEEVPTEDAEPVEN